MKRRTLFSTRAVTLLGVVLVSCAGPLSSLDPATAPPAQEAKPVRVGSGYYLDAPPPGEKVPSNSFGEPAMPKVVTGFSGVPVTSKWWSSLMWQADRAKRVNPYSENMYPHPLSVRAGAGGLVVGYPTKPIVEKSQYNYWLRDDLLVGLDGLDAKDARVESFGDWTVTAAWDAGKLHLRATMGRGLPFVYFTATGGTATVTLKSAPPDAVWFNREGMLGVSVGEQSYGIFGPAGSEWQQEGRVLSSELAGKGYLAVAALPDRSEQTLRVFRAHAFAFVTGSHVAWSVDPATSTVTSTFSLDVTPKETGGVNLPEPLVALYRHQWMHMETPVTRFQFVSPRGAMKVVASSSFSTKTTYTGTLPLLPPPSSPAAREEIVDALSEAAASDDWYPVGSDWKHTAYTDGKSLQRIATLARIADELGERTLRDRFVAGLEAGLQDWFDGVPPRAFYYDHTWRTLLPTPALSGIATELNDHHCHYGYFLQAAAAVAQLDPGWAARYGAFVELLAADVANVDRDDTRAPFLRFFDAYAGHSWSSGQAAFDEGNNEESPSEDTNFAAGLVLWGAQVGNRKLRDAGLWMMATEADAIEQYWFDADHEVFPKSFERPLVAMLWDSGGRYSTWWDPEPIYAHGIDVIPLTAASLYRGRRPDVIARDYDYLVKVNRGDPLLWRDIFWKDLALADPARARQLYDANRYFTTDLGDSRANLLYWIDSLAQLGHLDTGVTADAPTAATFRAGTRRTHAGYNAGGAPATIRFSDGTALDIPPRAMRTATTTVQP